MSVYEIRIDPSSAEAGAAKIVRSFESIQAAAGRMERNVTASANKLLSTFRQLSNVRTVSREAVSQLNALSSALSGFRGPSRTAVDNTTRFLSFLRTVGRFSLPSGSSMAAFLAAMTGFRGPTATAGRNTQTVLRALSGFTAPAGIGSRVTGFLTALGAYRGPSPTAGRNTLALLNAISSFSGTPRNLSAAIRQFDALAAAIARAGAALRAYRGTALPNIRAPSVGGGGFNPRNMARDMDYLQGAVVRTNTAFNALGGILAARTIITASNDVVRIRAQLEAATGSASEARRQFAFLREQTERLGLDFRETARSFGFFLGAIRGTNMTVEESNRVFMGFSTAARALQLSTSDVEGVFRALGQIMSKGRLQAEELRGQLGDRLPGAFTRMAQALNMTRPGQLDDALRRGAISGEILRQGILRMAATLERDFAPTAERMSRTVDAAFNRLKNSFTFSAEALGRSGLNEALINLMDSLRRLMNSTALDMAMRVLGATFAFVGRHANLFGSILGGYLLASTIRIAASFLQLNRVIALFMGLRAAAAVGSIAVAMGTATVATGRLTAATNLLTAALLRNPYVIIGVAIAGYIYYLTQATSASDQFIERLNNSHQATAIAENATAAFESRMADLSAGVARNTGVLDENTQAIIRNYQAQLMNANVFGVSFERGGGPTSGVSSADLASIGLTDQADRNQGGWFLNGTRVTSPGLIAYLRNTRSERHGGQQWGLDRGGQPQPERYRRLLRNVGQLGWSIQNDMTMPEEERRVARLEQQRGAERARLWARRNPEIARRIDAEEGLRDPATPPVLSGDPMERNRRNRSGAGAARAYEQDIRRALEALRDLRRETTASTAEMNAYLELSRENINAQEEAGYSTRDAYEQVQRVQARGRAEAQVNQFMDSFRDVSTASRGLIELNGRMNEQTDILSQLSPAAQAARQSLIDFFTQQELAAEQARRANEAARGLAELRQENDIRRDTVEATRQGGQALVAANIQAEIQRRLIGVSEEQAALLRDRLREQLTEQLRINQALQVAEDNRRDLVEAATNAGMATRYNDGYNEREMEYYRELLQMRNQMIDEGYTTAQINSRLRVRAAAQQQLEIERQLQDQYQRSTQLARDQADAIVSGFREGINEGQNFLSIFKNIFNSLKNIILDFVLYNPLREFLTQTLARGNTQQFVSGSLANSAVTGAQSMLSTVFSGSLFGPSVSSTFGGQGGPLQGLTGDSDWGRTGPTSLVVGAATDALEDSSQAITVTGQRQVEALQEIPQTLSRPRFFDGLRNMFNFRENFSNLGKVFTGGIRNLGQNLPAALGAAGNAFAAYSIGKGLAKGLGLGRIGGEVVGGAAAGFSVGGPIGAGIGAVLGLAKGFLFKPKMASSYGNVTVGDNGVAMAGSGGKYGKGTVAAGAAAASAGASLFNTFAQQFDGMLRAGNFGTFGKREFKVNGDKQEMAFYSATGRLKKGKPLGAEGSDWIKGTESEVQAFALKNAINRGLIAGLSETIMTIARNTRSTTMEGLGADFEVGNAYDDFIKGSFRTSDLKKRVDDLNEGWRRLSKQAAALGLSETKLAAARDRMIATMKQEFDFEINQGILGITDPLMAAYNQLVKEYRDSVSDAMAVGGDLSAVERYYGLKRKEILEEYNESAFQQIRNSARDLLNDLTATTNSPLGNTSVLANAQSNFRGLASQIAGGDLTNVESVGQYANAYLDSAREQFGSSTDFFDIFREVTDFLRSLSTTMPLGNDDMTTPDELPELPSLQALIDEITASNAEIGAAIIETGAETNENLQNIASILSGGGSGSLNSPLRTLGGSGGGGVRVIGETTRVV